MSLYVRDIFDYCKSALEKVISNKDNIYHLNFKDNKYRFSFDDVLFGKVGCTSSFLVLGDGTTRKLDGVYLDEVEGLDNGGVYAISPFFIYEKYKNVEPSSNRFNRKVYFHWAMVRDLMECSDYLDEIVRLDFEEGKRVMLSKDLYVYSMRTYTALKNEVYSHEAVKKAIEGFNNNDILWAEVLLDIVRLGLVSLSEVIWKGLGFRSIVKTEEGIKVFCDYGEDYYFLLTDVGVSLNGGVYLDERSDRFIECFDCIQNMYLVVRGSNIGTLNVKGKPYRGASRKFINSFNLELTQDFEIFSFDYVDSSRDLY